MLMNSIKNFIVKHVYIIIISIISLIILCNVIVLSVKAFSEEKLSVPIIMYHSILKDDSKSCDYIITPALLEKDLIYLRDYNYTTIVVNDLINYVEKDMQLPPKPVMLTFDDGFYNNLTYVLPLLKKYNMTAVISVVGEYTEQFSENKDENTNYSYLSYENIIKLKHSERVEIGNHSYKMHTDTSERRGAKINPGESLKDYQNLFIADTMKTHFNLMKNCNITPNVYAFPYGFYTDDAMKSLKGMGYKAAFICAEKPNYITRDRDCLFGLNRYNRPAGISTDKFMKKALDDWYKHDNCIRKVPTLPYGNFLFLHYILIT